MTWLYICHNLAYDEKDKLAENTLIAFTKGNNTFKLIFITFCTSTFAPTLAFGPLGIYTNINL